ncbi:cadherin-like domain-containing protein [Polaromonas sp. P1(28)-13]|nr:cadherin-like domain-containing protein [Polaromonas sp. P1(28)-13]
MQHLAIVKTNANTGEVSNGTASDFIFDFGNGAKLTVSMMEKLVIVVNGETIDPQAPYITSNGAGQSAAVTIAENTTAVTTVAAFDNNAGTTLTYSLVSGHGDNSLFTINPTTGALSFINAPNFEAATDGGTNNVYDVKVQVSDGARVDTQLIAVTVSDVNEAPVTTPVTLAAIAEDSGARLITQAELLANASDVDNASLTAIGLVVASGGGTLLDNANGTWSYTPALNDDTAVSFSYTVSDGSLTAAGSATLDITPVNDAPVTTPVTLAAIAEDSGARLITQAELLANASDVDGPSLTAIGLAVAAGSGGGTLLDNANGTWSYTPALNDDTAVSFSYTVSDGSLTAAGSATLDITPVNDAPVTTPVTLAAIAEDSGARLITQAELLANASDVDGPSLTAIGLAVAAGSGGGTLLDNANGTWSYTPALNDDTAVSFSYTVSDGSLTAAGSATLDITPVNDAPVTTPVTLAAIAEDSGARLITQAELLANASDVDGPSLTAIGLAVASGGGTLLDNANGTWSYTPALNDDTAVSFSYTVSDGSLTAAGSATLDITPVNDAPVTTPVTLAAIAEDSGARLITQAELLANASDVDNASLTAIGLAVASGGGTLLDNANGTWSYTPALNDDTAVSFSYTVSDGSLTAAGSATLDITPVNDAPVTTPVTLAAIAEDSGARLITQAELLANASDVDNASLTAIGLVVASGGGTLLDNANGTWSYTPALNDDTAVSFSYTVSDGSLTAAGSATLDITPVNDAASDLIFSFTGAPGNSLPNGNFGQMSLIDPDGGALSYSYLLAALTATTLSGGVATGFASDLSVNSTGAISANNLDDNRDYEMSIQVTQGTATFTGNLQRHHWHQQRQHHRWGLCEWRRRDLRAGCWGHDPGGLWQRYGLWSGGGRSDSRRHGQRCIERGRRGRHLLLRHRTECGNQCRHDH